MAVALTQDVAGNGNSRSPSKVPRWRLAREGPFLAERSSSVIRSFGAGCAFRQTTYLASDYASPSGAFGVPLNHPRFLARRSHEESDSISGGFVGSRRVYVYVLMWFCYRPSSLIFHRNYNYIPNIKKTGIVCFRFHRRTSGLGNSNVCAAIVPFFSITFVSVCQLSPLYAINVCTPTTALKCCSYLNH